MNEVDKDKTYYIHCAGGYRSVIAASILKARGFNNLLILLVVLELLKKQIYQQQILFVHQLYNYENTLKIQNLKCGGCANTIITQLSKLNGISDIDVNNEHNELAFNYVRQNLNELKITIYLGYPNLGEANSLPKKAKSFVSCAIGRMIK